MTPRYLYLYDSNMALNIILMVQTTLYLSSFFLSFFVSIPLGITKVGQIIL